MGSAAGHWNILGLSVLVLLLVSNFSNSEAGVSAGFYADNGIDQTIIYHTISKKEKREMQQEILSLLGLHHRPKPTPHGTSDSAPKFMIDLYKTTVNDEDVEVNSMRGRNDTTDSIPIEDPQVVQKADIIMSFVNHGHHLVHSRHDKDRRFWFDVSEVPPEETIMTAELRLYKEPFIEEDDSERAYNITIYKVIQGEDSEDKELHYLDSKSVSSSDGGWLMLNVTPAAVDWVVFPDTNLGLYLTITAEHMTGGEIHPSEIGLIGVKGVADKQPFMVAMFQTPQDVRVRRTRAVRQKHRQDANMSYMEYSNPYMAVGWDRHARRSCQKRSLFVSFKELGWQDWIIAPDGYAAFYCHGECSFPLNAHMNATNHAIVQTLVHLMHPYSVPKPCCAPTKLAAISVLYFDDNSNVILKRYKNMVVKSCGCH